MPNMIASTKGPLPKAGKRRPRNPDPNTPVGGVGGGNGGGGPSGGGGHTSGGGGGIDWTPPAPPNFLPMTPAFEAGRRSAMDTLTGQLQQIGDQRALIKPQVQQQEARMGTDIGYARQSQLE